MLTKEQQVREEEFLVRYLIDRTIAQGSGELEAECHYNHPRDVYFIGNLKPKDEARGSLAQMDFQNKISPAAIGAEFKINLSGIDELTVDCKITWNCYYRAFPTYKQQLEWLSNRSSGAASRGTTASVSTQNESAENLEGNQVKSAAEVEMNHARRRTRVAREDIFVRYKKIKLEAVGFIKLTRQENDWHCECI